MWLKKLRRLIRLFFFQLTGKKGDKVAKLTKPVIAVNIDGTVRVLNQDPNATHFNWYTRELLSYNITSPSYDTVVAGTNESTTALPNSSYTNRVYITESYRDIRKFTSFKLYEAGSSAVDVTELYVTKISDFEYSISIPNVEHDYIITWGVGAITYTITSSLTNCVADKSDESYVGGTAVNIVITAATGYTFDSSLGGTIGLSVGEVDKTSEYMTRSSDNKKVTIAIPAIAAVGNIIYAAGAVEEIVQLATPTIAMNADGKTLEITDVENATSYDVYVDGTMKTNVASVPNTTTFDLSTLSDIADGTHTVKVKAKADGYIDSEFSNEVSYTKAPAGYSITLYAMKHTWKNAYAAPCIKLDVAPTSADDYDYTMTTDDTKKIMDKADTHRAASMNIGTHSIVYVFSSDTSGTEAYAKYNGQIFGSGKNYNNADIITLDGTSDRIDLYSEGQD